MPECPVEGLQSAGANKIAEDRQGDQSGSSPLEEPMSGLINVGTLEHSAFDSAGKQDVVKSQPLVSGIKNGAPISVENASKMRAYLRDHRSQIILSFSQLSLASPYLSLPAILDPSIARNSSATVSRSFAGESLANPPTLVENIMEQTMDSGPDYNIKKQENSDSSRSRIILNPDGDMATPTLPGIPDSKYGILETAACHHGTEILKHILGSPNGCYPSSDVLYNFLDRLLPKEDRGPADVSLPYHKAQHPRPIKRMILSLTATQGVYSHLTAESAVFLHRPWDLDRRRMGRSNSVFASHKAFDALFTTGYNIPLMLSLGGVHPMVPIIGYKSEPGRKMGIVAKIPSQSLKGWRESLAKTFGDECESFIPDDMSAPAPKAIAIMNAFDPDMINRAIVAGENLYPTEGCSPTEIIYLTGETRPMGEQYAAERSMPVMFAGHRRSEIWGLRLLEKRLKEAFPAMEVVVVDEEEEEMRTQMEKRERDKIAQDRKRKATQSRVEEEGGKKLGRRSMAVIQKATDNDTCTKS